MFRSIGAVAEVLVDLVAAAQEFVEAVWSDGDRERQPDARPDRITAADPIPEAEHPRRLDAELRHLVELGRDGGEMVADSRLANALGDPGPGGRRVGHRLHRGEGLRRDDEQGARRIEPAQRVADVGAIDVGDEMAPQLRRREGRERPRSHCGPKVGSANADIDDVRHRLAQSAPHPALAHVGGEGQHLFARADHLRHDILAVDQHRLAGEIAQGGMQDGALLGDVDLLASEHGRALGLDSAGLGELDERA